MFARRPKTYRTKPVRDSELEKLNFNQEKVEGFSLDTYQAAHALLIGAGAIGGHSGLGLIRKGMGFMTLLDDDRVEVQNNTRQLFSKSDIGRFKSHRLGKFLSTQGMFPGKLTCYPLRFLEWVEAHNPIRPIDIIICGVDNNPTRTAVTQYALLNDIPVIHAAVSRDGNQLYVAQQIPGEACWGCQFPQYLNGNCYPCNLPGIIDITQVVAGLIVYAVDTVLCNRPCEWNVREIFLDGSVPDRVRTVEINPKCPLCQSQQNQEKSS